MIFGKKVAVVVVVVDDDDGDDVDVDADELRLALAVKLEMQWRRRIGSDVSLDCRWPVTIARQFAAPNFSPACRQQVHLPAARIDWRLVSPVATADAAGRLERIIGTLCQELHGC